MLSTQPPTVFNFLQGGQQQPRLVVKGPQRSIQASARSWRRAVNSKPRRSPRRSGWWSGGSHAGGRELAGNWRSFGLPHSPSSWTLSHFKLFLRSRKDKTVQTCFGHLTQKVSCEGSAKNGWGGEVCCGKREANSCSPRVLDTHLPWILVHRSPNSKGNQDEHDVFQMWFCLCSVFFFLHVFRALKS